jgi:HD-like signal output (HDOD) protein
VSPVRLRLNIQGAPADLWYDVSHQHAAHPLPSGEQGPAGPGSDLRARLVERLRSSLVEQGASLPLQSQAALGRVIALCEDPRASARGVALEAARDEGFAALLLRVANSAHSMSATRIADLTQAVARLGFGFVQGLAVASMAAPGFGDWIERAPEGEIDHALREQHRHSVRVGLVARAIAPTGISPEVALTAGLLHNLGLSVLAMFAPRAFQHLLAAARQGQQLQAVELDVLGFTHAELGALLAKRWSYPAQLVAAIGQHDLDEPSDRLAAVVHVADLMIREAGVGIEAPSPVPPRVAALADLELAGILRRVEPLLAAQDRLEERMAQELAAGGGPRT